ncbi:uncharacterized protein F4822DRAFT_210226 [Hypoxylon trugodes]|uniref:uncharacterized protein n=1 Tax=Hypoxylon trugodes TaxID=326681 RepID=UPI00219F9705|nr:uncharacterized protein F4822DRAFT_210226 [Hypoxylon trugodes]KAI1389702.1 hypothetical protein F4822DRAFT_210226 [Hypoxylon trugodes]
MSSETSNTAPSTRPPFTSGWLAIPSPLARLFKKFPLLTYPPNELPTRSASTRDVATLYVFISDQYALKGLPSFNPSCLKWQTFLKLAGVEFQVAPSNNHASPTGALPFLIPPSNTSNPSAHIPIPSNKLEKYAAEKGTSEIPDVSNLKLEAYESLLDYRIRNAWLYSLYLSRPNSALLSQLYVEPISTSQPIRATILYQLRHAAEAEILKSTGTHVVNSRALYRGAREAFEALSTVLGEEEWFFGVPEPTLFDAAVFAYTYLLLDDRFTWEDPRLREIVKEFPILIEHRNRILHRCWGIQKAKKHSNLQRPMA